MDDGPANPTRLDPETGELTADGDGSPCPACGADFFEDGPCYHVVTTWDFCQEGGWWIGDNPDMAAGLSREELRYLGSEMMERFGRAVNLLVDRNVGDDSAAGAIPGELRGPRSEGLRRVLTCSLEEGRFDGHSGNDYLEGLIRAAPTFLGWIALETTGMCSSSFRAYYAEDAATCAESVQRAVSRDIRRIERLIRKSSN